MPTVSASIAYLDGSRLRRSLLAAADWVDAAREELNRINVFPVPDGPTTQKQSPRKSLRLRIRRTRLIAFSCPMNSSQDRGR